MGRKLLWWNFFRFFWSISPWRSNYFGYNFFSLWTTDGLFDNFIDSFKEIFMLSKWRFFWWRSPLGSVCHGRYDLTEENIVVESVFIQIRWVGGQLLMFSRDICRCKMNFPSPNKGIFINPLQPFKQILRNLPLIKLKTGHIRWIMWTLLPSIKLIRYKKGRFIDLIGITGITTMMIVMKRWILSSRTIQLILVIHDIS